ncbi:flavodoxin [Candidatus Woesearchaeota archaeon]|nr:flavodoxin [Candidatus Woesearchaeota archaeon]
MKTLVAYYSRTGKTKKAALDIAKEMGADIDEIKDRKKRGVIGIIAGCIQGIKKKPSEVIFSKDPKKYGLVILGGPVWGHSLIPPLRGYMEKNKGRIKKLAFFMTCGGSPGKTLKHLSDIKKPIADTVFIDRNIKAGKHKEKMKGFVKKLKAAITTYRK